MKTTIICGVLLTFGTTIELEAEEGYGNITGQFVLQEDIPKLKPLVPKGANVKDAHCCSKQAVPDESFIVDAKTKGIANVFVYLRRAPAKIHPDLAKVPQTPCILNCKKCRYVPRCAIIRCGQQVLFKSEDNCAHNHHIWPLVNDPWSYFWKAQEKKGIDVSRSFEQAEILPVKLTCDIHSWMKGYLFATDHPYAVVTDAQGKFTIEKLPVGEHSFRVWHESAGYLEKSLKVTVESGKTTDLGTLRVELKKFELPVQ